MRSELASTIPEVLIARAEQTPLAAGFSTRGDGKAWVDSCWQDVGAKVAAMANRLKELGFRHGDRMLIIGRPSADWETLNLAVLALGGVVIGLEPHAPDDYLQFVAEQSDCTWWAIDDEILTTRIPKLTKRRLAAPLKLHEVCNHNCDSQFSLADFLNVNAEDLATIIYTSGTTGTPKGIAYTHRQLLVACDAILNAFPQLQDDDKTLCWLPMAHLFQRMMNVAAIARGVTIHFVADPRSVADCAKQVKPAVIVGVPRFFEKLHAGMMAQIDQLPIGIRTIARGAIERATAAGPQDSGEAASSQRLVDRIVYKRLRDALGGRIRFMVTGSAPAPLHVLTFFHGIGLPLLEAYGVSENSIPMAVNRVDEFRVGSVGKPMPGNEIKFAADGEILVRGPGVFGGYEKDAARHRFTDDGFYHTGDIGEVDDDGYLYLTGRKSHLIKTSTGRKVIPAKVESHHSTDDLIDSIVVFGNNHPFLVALLVLNQARLKVMDPTTENQGYEVLDKKLREEVASVLDRLGADLPPHERIRRFAILKQPLSIENGELTPTLKIRRKFIEEKYAKLLEQLYREPEGNRVLPIVLDQNLASELGATT
ncbi:MAG: long-chain fatty acid--CoA ligase [Planctomycetales bacterium]|nr:long-chain fatty acid--CoA ligase [Planctomycetales bacterium]